MVNFKKTLTKIQLDRNNIEINIKEKLTTLSKILTNNIQLDS